MFGYAASVLKQAWINKTVLPKAAQARAAGEVMFHTSRVHAPLLENVSDCEHFMSHDYKGPASNFAKASMQNLPSKDLWKVAIANTDADGRTLPGAARFEFEMSTSDAYMSLWMIESRRANIREPWSIMPDYVAGVGHSFPVDHILNLVWRRECQDGQGTAGEMRARAANALLYGEDLSGPRLLAEQDGSLQRPMRYDRFSNTNHKNKMF